MSPSVAQELSRSELTPFHQAMLDLCLSRVRRSRRYMSSYYADWDAAYKAFALETELTESDKKAAERREPVHTVIPLSRAQALTFVTLNMSTLLQRPRLFELQGVGPEDEEPARVAEALLDNDLRNNRYIGLLWQWLLNIAIFGVGIFKIAYTRRHSKKLARLSTEGLQFAGTTLEAGKEFVDFVDTIDFIGNELEVISPYNFFPDPSVTISEFQKGEFVASEAWVGRHILAQMEADGQIAGLEFVRKSDAFDTEGSRRRMPMDTDSTEMDLRGDSGQSVLVTEVQINIVPSQFLVDGKPLGDEKQPVKWMVWIANDHRIIKCEPLGFVHNQFTYAVAELYPDVRSLCNNGVVGSILNIQDVVNWLINSHITNVRKVIGDKLVVKSSFVEYEDLRSRAPVIRVKEEANDIPLTDIIQQLSVVDVTTNHVRDAQVLIDLAQTTTGVTDNALGMYHTGRRSAREAASVAQYTSARLRIPTLQMYTSCLEPMARQMLSNHQQFLDAEVVIRAVSDTPNPEATMRFIKASREKLVGSYDFVILDATTPSERVSIATAISELFVNLPGGLQTVISLGYDPQKLLNEWMILMGIKHPERFKLEQARAQELVRQVVAAQQLYGLNPLGEPAQGRAAGRGAQVPSAPAQ